MTVNDRLLNRTVSFSAWLAYLAVNVCVPGLRPVTRAAAANLTPERCERPAPSTALDTPSAVSGDGAREVAPLTADGIEAPTMPFVNWPAAMRQDTSTSARPDSVTSTPETLGPG